MAVRTAPKRTTRGRSQNVLTPCNGIFYIVRFPDGWTPIALRFDNIEDCGHPEFWWSQVVPKLAGAWSPALGRTVSELRTDLRLCEYGFPRGRVVKQRNRFVILHGDELESFMKLKRREIETLFGIPGRATWREDEHEQCLNEDKETVRETLCLKENWKVLTSSIFWMAYLWMLV